MVKPLEPKHKLIARLHHPPSPRVWTLAAFTALRPQRKTQRHRKPISYFWNDVTYTFDSLAEKRIFRWFATTLSPQAMAVQSYKIVREKPHQAYFPDLQILDEKGTLYLVEVKSTLDLLLPDVHAKYTLLQIHAEKEGLGYALMDQRGYTMDYFLDTIKLQNQPIYNTMKTLFKHNVIAGPLFYDHRNEYAQKDQKKAALFTRIFVAYALQHGYVINQSFRTTDWQLMRS